MHQAIATLKGYEIPTRSFVAAVKHLGELEFNTSEYRRRIEEMSGHKSKMEDKFVRHQYHYLVQETIRRADTTDKLDMDELFDLATKKTEQYIKKNPWVFAERETEGAPKLDAAGNPKQKKGAKREQAIALWNKHKDENLTRKQWIELLVKEVGMTPAGASTYHANLKANRM